MYNRRHIFTSSNYYQLCQLPKLTFINGTFIIIPNEMWNDVRKSYRSPQKTSNIPQRLSTTCLITPAKGQKPTVRQLSRQCPLHFNQPSHICLTCRKSICLRCALTYCQQHMIRNECQAIVQLRQQVLRLQITPKIEQLQIKLEQSHQRQEYLQKKILKLIQSIQNHFDYISQMLNKKKLQIIEFYDQEFQKYLQEHRNYDTDIKKRIDWLKQYSVSEKIYKIQTIEQIDLLSMDIKKAGQEDSKIEKKITKMLMGKDKIRIEKLWSQENLQRILYQIEHIPFKLDQKCKNQKGKKRVTTENAIDGNHNNLKFVKSSNNSRFSSGRKGIGP